ncbi:GldM family protein [Winogradskyella sp.]|uniref:GldM family protein n=1 Tax=Winogradskyella sp. TaxID=1883156 RepID=UPI003BAA826A
MKHLFSTLFILFIIQSCKTSYSKTELLKENNILKERLKAFEALDTLHNKTALELKNMNVVYRGISNPIYISKPNALSFEASAFGLKKKDNYGNYALSPGSGHTVDIKIKSKLKNGDSLIELKTLRIKDIGNLNGTINRLGCGAKCEIQMSKEELANAEVGVKVNDFLLDWEFKVNGFKIYLHGTTYDVKGNKINDSTKPKLKNLRTNDEVIIFDIKLKIIGAPAGLRYKNPSPISINIVENN